MGHERVYIVTSSAKPTLRGVALPAEHGSWGLIAEPILLGLLVAPSWGGLSISLFAMAAFLARVPLLRHLKWRGNQRQNPRRGEAGKALGIYTAVAVFTVVGAVLLADAGWWIPLLIAAPPGILSLLAQARGEARQLLPEIIGASVLGGVVTAISLAGSFPPVSAYVLWILLILKSLTAILFVRHQLRRKHGRPSSALRVMAWHGGAAVLAASLCAWEKAPWLILVAFIFLALRAALLMRRPVQSAKHVGWTEVGVTLVFLAIVVLSYRLD